MTNIREEGKNNWRSALLSSHIHNVKFVWLEPPTTINELHIITKDQPLSSL